MNRKRVLVGGSIGVLVVIALLSGWATRRPNAQSATPNRSMGVPIFLLNDDAYLRWPLPEGMPQYGKLDGREMKRSVEQLVSISNQSRRDGHQWWGRITGTEYHVQTQTWIADRFRELGLQVRLQEFELPPAWFPTRWEMTATSGGKKINLKTAQPVMRSSGTLATGLELEPVYVGLGSS